MLRWDVPAGSWQVLRFGYTIGDRSYVSTSSEGWNGYSLDVLDAGAFRRYWDAVVEPLIADAGPLAGTALKYLHTDSWEVEPLNWTPTIREEFQAAPRLRSAALAAGAGRPDRREPRREQSLPPRFPQDAGRPGDRQPLSPVSRRSPPARAADPSGVGRAARRADRRAALPGLQRRADVGVLGLVVAAPDRRRQPVLRQAAGIRRAHLRTPVSSLPKGFTTIGPHWQETLWDNLKPSFDKACCEGLNLLVWHEFVCSPAEQGLPGIQYFAGTHLNPNVTWWSKSAPFFDYINRCQFMLQQGLFVADACYYYGDHVPNFAQHKRTDPAHVLPGYDYDVITEEALLTRAIVQDGRIVLPDGMSYRVLVLRNHQAISLPVLRKVKELVEAGATVVGPKPDGAMSLQDSDAEVQADRRLAVGPRPGRSPTRPPAKCCWPPA